MGGRLPQSPAPRERPTAPATPDRGSDGGEPATQDVGRLAVPGQTDQLDGGGHQGAGDFGIRRVTLLEMIKGVFGEEVEMRATVQETPEIKGILEGATVRASLQLEGGVPQDIRDELERRGHVIGRSDGGFGGYQAIRRDPVTGVLSAASEMRTDGAAMGY